MIFKLFFISIVKINLFLLLFRELFIIFNIIILKKVLEFVNIKKIFMIL